MKILPNSHYGLLAALFGFVGVAGFIGCAESASTLPGGSVGGAAANGGQTATGQGGAQQNATGGSATGGAQQNATGGAQQNATGGAATGGSQQLGVGGAATGGSPPSSTGGATQSAQTGGASSTGGATQSAETGGATSAGGASGTGGATGTTTFSPLCGNNSAGTAIAKDVPCTASDPQLCYKVCGPENKGFKSETCTSSVYVEQSGCSFPAGDYACYKIPTTMDATCPTTAPQHGATCTVATCLPCNLGGTSTGTYLDSKSASKVGWCVCTSAGKWSCASTNAWPCPGNTGC